MFILIFIKAIGVAQTKSIIDAQVNIEGEGVDAIWVVLVLEIVIEEVDCNWDVKDHID